MSKTITLQPMNDVIAVPENNDIFLFFKVPFTDIEKVNRAMVAGKAAIEGGSWESAIGVIVGTELKDKIKTGVWESIGIIMQVTSIPKQQKEFIKAFRQGHEDLNEALIKDTSPLGNERG